MTNSVLIIGGGIAGTVAGIALTRAGCAATVYEAFEHGADGVGLFLTLAVNGVDALRAIDIDAASLGGFDTPRMAIRLGSGELLADLPNGPTLAGGAVSRTITRAGLYASLRDEALRRGVRFVYGKRLVDAGPAGDGTVVARFEDGTDAVGTFLVGADGLYSRVRRIIDPRAPEPHYLGLLNTGGRARGVTTPTAPGTFEFVFGKRCFFGYVPAPDGDVWWFANPGRAKEPSRAELAAVSPEAWRAELLDLLAEDATPAAALVAATETIARGWGTHDLRRVPRWSRDRMLIIGDAAHAASPSSGQGASMAIEDAIVLARCVRDAPSVESAFATYEAARRPRVERVVAVGRRNGTGKTPGLVGRGIRDLVLRLVFRNGAGGAEALRWMYDHPIRWEEEANSSGR
jgi:FAD-dependent urate hydroxylase